MILPVSNSRIQLPQGQIFWREVGYGEPLVFLHGSHRDNSQWLSVMEQLSSNYRCFAPDLLGFGDSEHPDVHYSIAWQVECLETYLDALNLQQFYLIGHSLGGWIAASYALKNMKQVLGLVILSPEGIEVKKNWGQQRWEKCLIARPPIMFWLLRSLFPIARILRCEAKIGQSLQYRQKLLNSPATCKLLFQRQQAEIQTEFLSDKLSWLKVPTLILQGGQDTPENITRSQTFASQGAITKLEIINHGNNDLPEALPQEVAQKIDEFITQS